MVADHTIDKLDPAVSLGVEETQAIVSQILEGKLADEDIKSFLNALAQRGESEAEILGCVRAMLSRTNPFDGLTDDIQTMDIGGTGGDGLGLFNISTTAALVTAASGVPVLKHGNRSVSSQSGSADMIEALGVALPLTPDPQYIMNCLKQTGIAYLFTPVHHVFPSNLSRIRRQLGIRTIFNLAGPLAHPVAPNVQMIGVSQLKLIKIFSSILNTLGRQRAWVFHGSDGADEISLSGPTYVSDLAGSRCHEFTVTPDDFGIEPAPVSAIRGGNADENAEICRRIFDGRKSPYFDVVLLTSGAALFLAGKAVDLKEGVRCAEDTILSGDAKALLKRFREVSHDCSG